MIVNSAKKSLYRYAILAVHFILFTSLIAQDVVSENGMVASAHPLASQAGLETLEAGGNAIDAMVATVLALAVVEPNASGLGGGGFMTIKTTDSPAFTIDFRETAPAKASPELYYKSDKSFEELTHSGAHSVGVPGTVAGLFMALEEYGSMSFSEVAKPAIKLANDGFEVSPKFESMIIQAYDLIEMNPSTAAIYLDEGLPKSAGAKIKNPDFAITLEQLSVNGAKCFYKGKIAKAVSSSIKEAGGILTADDMSNYKAIVKKPVTGSYRGYQIVSTAPPSGGGTHLVELLNILDGFNLKEVGHNSAEFIHLFAEAQKMIMADKAMNMADPDFYEVPVKRLTDKNYAKELRNHITPENAKFDYQAPDWLSRQSNSTTHLSVVDKQGNMVALTHSINLWFGSGMTAEGTGIILNNHLADFASVAGAANSIEPGKRPVSSIAPTILLKDGKPFLTIGTPGGSRIIGALAQIIINIVDFEMGIDEAIEAPRIHSYKKILHLEGRISEAVQNELTTRGHKLKIHSDYDNYFGGAQGIIVNSKTGKLYGGADSRRDGVALGH